jgi:hypothetical protein
VWPEDRAHFFHRRQQAVARVIDKNIQSAELLVCLLNNLLHLLGIGRVERRRQRC